MQRNHALDTGFVCYHRGWYDLRTDDLGGLWEHFVLNELHASLQSRRIGYWRDKRGHEVDFILSERRSEPVAIECKWTASDFDASGLLAFRRQYPHGPNYVVSSDVAQPFLATYGGTRVRFTSVSGLLTELRGSRHSAVG